MVTGAEVATIRVTEGVTPGVDKEDMDRVAGITKAGVTKVCYIAAIILSCVNILLFYQSCRTKQLPDLWYSLTNEYRWLRYN